MGCRHPRHLPGAQGSPRSGRVQRLRHHRPQLLLLHPGKILPLPDVPDLGGGGGLVANTGDIGESIAVLGGTRDFPARWSPAVSWDSGWLGRGTLLPVVPTRGARGSPAAPQVFSPLLLEQGDFREDRGCRAGSQPQGTCGKKGKTPNYSPKQWGSCPWRGCNSSCHQHCSETRGSALALAPWVSQACQFSGPQYKKIHKSPPEQRNRGKEKELPEESCERHLNTPPPSFSAQA